MIYEQTYLTWSEGPQMVGFTLTHGYPEFAFVGILCILIGLIAFISGLIFTLRKKARIAFRDWFLLGLLAASTFLILVGYGTWQALTTQLLGVGPHAESQLRDAVGRGDYGLLRYLIARGVPFSNSDPKIHLTLAMGLRKEGNLGGAIAEYRKAIKLDPGNVDAYLGLGRALELKGDFQGALQQYQIGCVQLGGIPSCDRADALARKRHP